MRHKHADMIIAKANNANLVQFVKFGDEWVAQGGHGHLSIVFETTYEYFLCLPQHKEAVLNILNNGESQVNYGTYWRDANCGKPAKWGGDWWYMNSECESRIKPRKEKRWIIVDPKSDYTFNGLYFTEEEASEESCGVHQVIEIEVEV